MNQARKRARMAQKFEETKTTITSELCNDLSDQNGSDFNRNFTDAAIVGSNDRDREKNFKNSNYASDDISALQMRDQNGTGDITSNNNQNSIKKDEGNELIDESNDKRNTDCRIIDKKSTSPSSAVLEERIKKFLKSKTFSSPTNTSENSSSQPETSQADNGRNESSKATDDFDDECAEHLYPNEVDSTNVTGEIIQVSPLCRYSARVKIQTEFLSNRYQVVYIIVHLSLVHLNSTHGAKT